MGRQWNASSDDCVMMISVTLSCGLWAIRAVTFSPSCSRSATIVAENTFTPLNFTSRRSVTCPDVFAWFADMRGDDIMEVELVVVFECAIQRIGKPLGFLW